MKTLIGLMMFLCFTGCACGRKEKVDLYRQALADTNASLTQARDENLALHKTVRRLDAQINAIKKQRRQGN